MRIRTLAALPILGVAALGLVACEKPAPGVSVTSGTTTAYREALCWSFDGSALSAYPDLQEVPAGGVALQVVAADGADTVGLWVFALVPGRGGA